MTVPQHATPENYPPEYGLVSAPYIEEAAAARALAQIQRRDTGLPEMANARIFIDGKYFKWAAGRFPSHFEAATVANRIRALKLACSVEVEEITYP